MDDSLRRELTLLLGRIVGDKPFPEDLRPMLISIVHRLSEPVGAPEEGVSSGSSPAVQGAAALASRRLIYVHGICRHDAGFSDDWWNSLQPFVTVFGAGKLNQNRLEVVWSNLVNSGVAAAIGAATPGARVAVSDEQARAQVAASIRETLQDRADQQRLATGGAASSTTGAAVLGGVASTSGAAAPPPVANLEMVTGSGSSLSSLKVLNADGVPVLGGGGGGSCLDDFAVYLVHEPTRQAIIDRFTAVVRQQLAAGNEIDVISHSWGTVVAYEGLRELEGNGVSLTGVRNFFTVGAALSIGAVKAGLRDQNRDGRKPTGVRRWVNLNARGDLVGGPLQGRPYEVDEDLVNFDPFGCGSLLGLVNPSCSHRSYFQSGNDAVNRDIFARFINA
jgi:metacaspase-1